MVPLRTTTEEETNWLPVAVRTKLGGNCEKTIVDGEIELRMGTARALPQSGFRALHPGRNRNTRSNELTLPIRRKQGMDRWYADSRKAYTAFDLTSVPAVSNG